MCISAIGDDDLPPHVAGLTAHAAKGLNLGIAGTNSSDAGGGEDGGEVEGVSSDGPAGDDEPDVKCIARTSLGVWLRSLELGLILPPKSVACSISSLLSSLIGKSECDGGYNGEAELWSRLSPNNVPKPLPASDGAEDG